MVDAAWDSDPRFSVGIDYRFIRSERRAFRSGGACQRPNFREGTRHHRYRVTLGSGNCFYLAASRDPPLANAPIAYPILTIPAGAAVNSMPPS